jgi:ABC-type polysaccharide/polyol phosphate export permease
MFPINPEHTALSWVMQLNPMSYIVDGVRRSFYSEIPVGTTVSDSAFVDLAVVLGFTLFSLLWANIIVNRSK